jgi:hypothetical protein
LQEVNQDFSNFFISLFWFQFVILHFLIIAQAIKNIFHAEIMNFIKGIIYRFLINILKIVLVKNLKNVIVAVAARILAIYYDKKYFN